MYVSRQNATWTAEETAWLSSQLEDPEVRDLVKKAGGKNDYGDAANLVCARYKNHFPNPRRGESADEFEARKAATRKGSKEKITPWKAESAEEHAARMDGLKRVRRQSSRCARRLTLPQAVRLWFAQQYTVKPTRQGHAKSSAGAPPPGPRVTAVNLNLARKQRAYSAFDAFQKSDDTPKKGDQDIGPYRHACHVLWQALSDEQRAHYKEEAQKLNDLVAAKRQKELDSQPQL